MNGLPESFDIAKRVFLFFYFPLKSDYEKTFDDVYQIYQNDYFMLKNELMQYRYQCENQWSQEKCRLGLPNPNARISFSKYMRIAHGLDYIEMQKIQDGWILKPTPSTHIINIISKLDQFKKNSCFELSTSLKLFFVYNLLKKDALFIIPILKSLNEVEVSVQTGLKNNDFLMKCANNLFNFSSNSFEMNSLRSEEIQSYIKKLKFFELNQNKISIRDRPTRGFLHLIEPRIHWFIDLLLIDNNQFCKNGTIKPANFLLDFLDTPNIQYEDLMANYNEYLFNQNSTDYSNNIQNQYTLDYSIDIAINELKFYYPKLIPLNPAITLIQIICSAQADKFVTSKKILERLNQRYTILRDWNPREGFLDLSSIE